MPKARLHSSDILERNAKQFHMGSYEQDQLVDSGEWYPFAYSAYGHYYNTYTEEALYKSNTQAIKKDFKTQKLSGRLKDVAGVFFVSRKSQQALELAEEIVRGLENYPVLDDQDLSDREWEAQEEAYDLDGRRDVVDAVKTAVNKAVGNDVYADNEEFIDELLDNEKDKTIENHLRMAWHDSCMYCGELWFKPEYGDSNEGHFTAVVNIVVASLEQGQRAATHRELEELGQQRLKLNPKIKMSDAAYKELRAICKNGLDAKGYDIAKLKSEYKEEIA